MSDWHNSVEYMNRDRAEKLEDLRQLADILENHPDIPMPDLWLNHNINVYKGTVNEITGKYETEYDSLEMVNLYARAQKAMVECDPNVIQHVPESDNDWDDPYSKIFMNNGLTYKVSVSRSGTCEKVIVGYETIPAEPAKFIEAKPERTEPKYEYRCNDRIAKVVVPKGVRVEG